MNTLSQVVEKFIRKPKSASEIEADLAAQTSARDAAQQDYAGACLAVLDEVEGAEKRKRAAASERARCDERIVDLQLALQGARAREQAAAAAEAARAAAEARAKAQSIVRAAIDARQEAANAFQATIAPFAQAYRALAIAQNDLFAAMNAGQSNSGIDLDAVLFRWDLIVDAIRAEMWRAGVDWDDGRFRNLDAEAVPAWSFEAAHDTLRRHAGLQPTEA